jgi:hypothetical protein
MEFFYFSKHIFYFFNKLFTICLYLLCIIHKSSKGFSPIVHKYLALCHIIYSYI